MWIRKVDLNDFGCFRRAHIEGLTPGLNIIAGPQRSGKTTFMQALRYLGYGFPKKKGVLPPPKDRYDVEVEIDVNGSVYLLKVQGYGAPRLVPQGNDSLSLTVRDLYGQLDGFSYRQLFTISLDELYRIPLSLEGKKEKDLAAVLLGAGLADVIHIPNALTTLRKEAKDLGGKHGTASRIGEHLDEIKKAEQIKKEALKQVDKYQEVREQLRSLDEEINNLEREAERLRLLERHFKSYREYRDLASRIQSSEFRERVDSLPDHALKRVEGLLEKYQDATKEWGEARQKIVESVRDTQVESRVTPYLEHAAELQFYEREISGWREKLKKIGEDQEKLKRDREQLASQVAEIRPEWRNNPKIIKNVKTDLFSRDRVKQAVEDCKEAQSELKKHQEALDDKQMQIDERKQHAKAYARWLLPGSLIVGFLLGFLLVNPTLGLVVGLLIALVPLGFYIHVQALETSKKSLEKKIDKIQTSLHQKHDQLRDIQRRLGLPDDIGPDTVLDFYEHVSDLRKQLENIEKEENRIHAEEKELADELANAAEVVLELYQFPWQREDPLVHAEDLFNAVEVCVSRLELAKEFDSKRIVKEDLESCIEGLFKEADPDYKLPPPPRDPEAVQAKLEAFKEVAMYRELRAQLLDALKEKEELFENDRKPDDQEPWVLDAFLRYADSFSSAEEVKKRLQTTEDNLNEKRLEKGRLEQQAEDLATDAKLRDAHEQLERARKRLEPLAERFAILRIAEFLLERLYEQFIQKHTGPLIQEASEIFKRLTGAEYAGVELDSSGNVLENVEFNTILADGNAKQKSDELSRATREQLFLAVRLTRIRQIQPPLPVILDDTTVNFDPAHQIRCLQIISELAKTHQVFLLTCHPEVVEAAAEHTKVGGYWKLANAKFEGPFKSPDDLIHWLRS